MHNRFEVVDKELLRLVSICKHLVDLKIKAFMDVFTVGRLLRTRLKQRSLLNKITVRKQTEFGSGLKLKDKHNFINDPIEFTSKMKIYSLRINVTKQEDNLKEALSFYEQQFPPELQVLADVIPVL